MRNFSLPIRQKAVSVVCVCEREREREREREGERVTGQNQFTGF